MSYMPYFSDGSWIESIDELFMKWYVDLPKSNRLMRYVDILKKTYNVGVDMNYGPQEGEMGA